MLANELRQAVEPLQPLDHRSLNYNLCGVREVRLTSVFGGCWSDIHAAAPRHCEDLVVRPVTLSIANAGGTLDAHLSVVSVAFAATVEPARRLLLAEGIDVVVIDAPEQTIPEWGVGGYTYGPHVIVVALDPSSKITEQHVSATLVHEFHHAMRWRGPGCEGSLAQMLVGEGLAQLVEEEVLGEAPFFSRVSITEGEIARAGAALYEPEFSRTRWFFGSDDITFHFGYTYGYQLCKAYSMPTGQKASELIDIPTEKVVELTAHTR
jgi:hypothetical protein